MQRQTQRCANFMTPLPVCTHVHPHFCICSPGSAEALFAMPALWTTRRESATAHPAPRGETARFSDRDPSRTGCSIPPGSSPWPLPALWSDQSCRLRQTALEWTDRGVEGGRSRGGSQERGSNPASPTHELGDFGRAVRLFGGPGVSPPPSFLSQPTLHDTGELPVWSLLWGSMLYFISNSFLQVLLTYNTLYIKSDAF